jgi:hypothetical protein
MIPFPFFIFPIDSETATTIEKEKVEWTDYNYSERLASSRLINIPDISELFDFKNNKMTTVIIDNDVDRSNVSVDSYQNVFSRDYDIHVPLLINKSFHFKGKVKSISRYKPTIHI